MADISLSTMWAQGRFHHLGDFVQAVRRLGFPRIEINYTVAPQGLDELLEMGDAIFPSLHAPVPRVKTSRGRWSDELNLASLDEEERRLAVDLARTTIDWAAKVGASCVVLHLGGVSAGGGSASGGGSEALPPEKELRRLFDAGQANSYRAELLRADCHRLRAEGLPADRQGAPAHLAQARASLRELADHAAALGIALGLENRYHFHEIPNVDEMKALLANYPPTAVGYWHDVGHAEVLDRLGLIDKHRWLRELGERCLGVHLHDVIGLKDHQAPGQGDADWDYIARYLPPTALRVCEIDQRTPEDAVAASIPFLRQRGLLPPQM